MRSFTSELGLLGLVMLLTAWAPEAGWAEPPPRAPLDALWLEHMLMGSGATIYVDESGQRTVSGLRQPFDEQRGVVSSVESAAWTSYGIEVSRLDERWLLWRNGGWIPQGGLLARVKGQLATLELYGKAISRRPPYVPRGPFPYDPPITTGYEFFLLLRNANTPRATILQQWTFQPRDVAKDGQVSATVQYGAATRTATVTITGLKRRVEETVETPF